MTIKSKGISIIGKLVFFAVLMGIFAAGLVGVVYMSLSGREVTVPELVGKDFNAGESELAALGLKIKRRAERVSTEKMNTVLEQLPKAGETVKTGQLILVVVSKAAEAGDQPPTTLKKGVESDDSEAIEEMISEKPKKPKANSNSAKKKADTTRDVIANSANSDKAVNDKSEAGAPEAGAKAQKNANVAPAKPGKTPPAEKAVPDRSGQPDQRPRTVQRPR